MNTQQRQTAPSEAVKQMRVDAAILLMLDTDGSVTNQTVIGEFLTGNMFNFLLDGSLTTRENVQLVMARLDALVEQRKIQSSAGVYSILEAGRMTLQELTARIEQWQAAYSAVEDNLRKLADNGWLGIGDLDKFTAIMTAAINPVPSAVQIQGFNPVLIQGGIYDQNH